jgi:hypothetical protein
VRRQPRRLEGKLMDDSPYLIWGLVVKRSKMQKCQEMEPGY